MRVTFVCNYCRRPEERELYMITLTSITNMKDTCTKIICSKCVARISAALDGSPALNGSNASGSRSHFHIGAALTLARDQPVALNHACG